MNNERERLNVRKTFVSSQLGDSRGVIRATDIVKMARTPQQTTVDAAPSPVQSPSPSPDQSTGNSTTRAMDDPARRQPAPVFVTGAPSGAPPPKRRRPSSQQQLFPVESRHIRANSPTRGVQSSTVWATVKRLDDTHPNTKEENGGFCL